MIAETRGERVRVYPTPELRAQVAGAFPFAHDAIIAPEQQRRHHRLGRQRFQNGRLGVLFGYRDVVPALRDTPNLDFDVLPMPRIASAATVVEMKGLCLSGATKLADRAADFLTYAVSDEAAALLAKTGYVVPTNTKVLVSSDFLQPALRPVNAGAFSAALKDGQLMPQSDRWTAVETAVNPLLAALFSDPIIEPLAERLKAIDQAGNVILNTPAASVSPSASTRGK